MFIKILCSPLHFVFRIIGALSYVAQHGYDDGFCRMDDRYEPLTPYGN